MPKQLSTSASDAVLAASAFYVAYQLVFWNTYACFGLLIEAAAASAGVARFSMSRPDGKVLDAHKMLTWLAITIGLPLLGVAFAYTYGYTTWGNLDLIFSVVVVGSSKFLPSNNQKLLTEAVSGFAMLTILLISFMHMNVYGLVMGALYVASGSVIGSEGYFHGFRRVDIMHYMLVAGNILLLKAL